MKKKGLIIGFFVLCISSLGVFLHFSNAAEGDSWNTIFSKWGKILSDSSKEKSSEGDYIISPYGRYGENEVSLDDIYEVGDDIIITKSEIEQNTKFYMLKGMDEKEAREMAIEFAEGLNAVYVEAIKNGYEVSDKEVEEEIERLKNTISKSENADDIQDMINQFKSEEDYWQYEKEQYVRLLPNQNYWLDFQDEYMKGLDGEEFSQDAYASYSEEAKKELVNKQHYRKVTDEKDIDAKFIAK